MDLLCLLNVNKQALFNDEDVNRQYSEVENICSGASHVSCHKAHGCFLYGQL